MKSTLIDSKKAAKILKISPQQVRSLCRNRKIPAQRISGSWVMREKDLSKYLPTRGFVLADDHKTYFSSREIEKTKKSKPIALSFFSGALGLDIGLEQAGFEVLLASEIDNACRRTILKNKPKIALISDIRDYSVKEIRQNAGLGLKDDIDLVVGGPPCQAFSTAGKRKAFKDERGNVFLTFIDIIINLQPKFAVIENVRGILSAPLKHRPHKQRSKSHPVLTNEERQGSALAYVLNILNKAGYVSSFNLYNSANFGTPQTRERVFIICSREGTRLPYLVPTHSKNEEFSLPKWRTFKEAVKGLPRRGLHHLEFPERRLKYYRLLKPGQYWRNLPKELHKEALGASYYAGGGKTGFLRRLAWDEPSPTLVTHPAMPATDLAHPIDNRPLSVEEYKRLQEFPDDWIIEGSLLDQYKQIGNAVPVGLGRAVGNLLMDYIYGKTIPIFNGFPYSRYKNTDDINWNKEYRIRELNSAQISLAV